MSLVKILKNFLYKGYVQNLQVIEKEKIIIFKLYYMRNGYVYRYYMKMGNFVYF